MNNDLKKVKMPLQSAHIRNTNFDEVALGYSEEQAVQEAYRCLQCKNPLCVKDCPVSVTIPQFIKKVQDRDFAGAYEAITSQNTLPAICGRVCPQEHQCERKCIRGIKGEPVAIGRLERFVADWYLQNMNQPLGGKLESNGKKVAVIGSGPAGLTCAGELAKKGYEVTLFEALHTLGGVLMYGIPEFRLPKQIVQKEINKLIDLGVKIEKNVVIGRSVTIDELLIEEGFAAVFVGTGAGLPNFLGIEGENLNGVYSANEFLTRINLMKAYDFSQSKTPVYVGKNVAVIGGGNVAMDAARTAKRLGGEKVHIVYRRSEDELPARLEEVHHAKEEGIEFAMLTAPKRILGEQGWVKGMECIRMELGEPDQSGRRKPLEVKDSEFMLDVDTVIVAIGQSPNPLIRNTTEGLEVASWGGIIVNNETMGTSRENIFAGGDVVTGAATVIQAMGAGKKAAEAIDKKLSSV